MKKLIVFLFCFTFLTQAQTLGILSPKTGDTLYQGDTVYFDYSADSSYMKVGNGIIISISANSGKYFNSLHSLANLGAEIYTIYLNDPSWGHIPIIIPDSVIISKVGAQATYKSTISDSIVFRIRDYSGAYPVISGAIKIHSAQDKPKPAQNSSGGCGKGIVLAFIPVLFIKAVQLRTRHRN